MHPKELRIEDYSYNLPNERIANFPLVDRTASKLLIYESGIITEDIYSNIANHIPEQSLMLFNQTKVIQARLIFRKPTGGIIEIFCLSPHDKNTDLHSAMQQKKHVVWECMVGGASKWKQGAELELVTTEFKLKAKIIASTTKSFTIGFDWDNANLSFGEVLQIAGKMPLPPYLHREAIEADKERYQTVFAKQEGSVAAPTAGLHFAETIFNDLEKKHIKQLFITLHVGAGTFRPVKSETMSGHDMHEEWISVSLETIEQLLEQKHKKIIAVGTTSLRTLESLYWIGNKLANGIPVDFSNISVGQWEPYETSATIKFEIALEYIKQYMQANYLNELLTKTQILIAPGYDFKVVDGLVTNFHQPQSTLLLLVAAFIGKDIFEVYNYALNNNFRFLSYGDGCLLWRKQ